VTDTDLLRDAARSDVYRLPAEAAWIFRAAKANGFAYWRVDLAAARDKSGLLAALARALELPDWFGGNWDALQDCLDDLSWRTAPGYVIVLEHCQGLAKQARGDFDTALEVFGAAAEFWREQNIPFWVFLGGLDDAQYDLPHLDGAG